MFRTVFALAALAGLCGAAHAGHFSRGIDLVNRSHATVSSFFVSDAGSERWDEDLLGRRGLQPNHFVQLDLPDPGGVCRFDFKTVFVDGTSVIRRNVDVCELRTYALTD
jgi:hypothetical protein